MVKLIVFLVIVFASLIGGVSLLVNGIRWIIKSSRNEECFRIINVFKGNIIFLAGIIILMTIYICITQITAHTTDIKDSDGKTVSGSIAELKKVNLNGHDEWISIRGRNKEAPVLLFLAGGPGGTQMAATRYSLSQLEDNFVVVNWDQPGSGKSYNCMKRSDITPETYVKDGIALTEYLKDRFGQEKIYLMGESWGSALGIFIISEKPEYYAGFIGTGQMVDFAGTERLDYKKAMEIAEEKGDTKTLQKLASEGEPPYYDGNISLRSATYLNYLLSYMEANPEITNGGFHTFRDMFSSEYGIVDSINYLRGIINTFNVVYPQLYETDLRKDYAKLHVPVYFFLGRHDVNAPTSLSEEYYKVLDAPQKKLVWFEHSGHNPWISESDLFVKETLKAFRK